jgi:beta-glucosidase/6-phospho-beta-glucosidase/beta-galactosidase
MNEPTKAVEGYGGNVTGSGYAPNVSAPGVGTYLAAHIMLKAHAAAYHLYNEKYRESQKGKQQSLSYQHDKTPTVALLQLARREFLCWILGPETSYSKYLRGCP